MLFERESGAFTGGADGDEKVDAGLDLTAHETAEGGLIEAAIFLKGRDEGRAASLKHRDLLIQKRPLRIRKLRFYLESIVRL